MTTQEGEEAQTAGEEDVGSREGQDSGAEGSPAEATAKGAIQDDDLATRLERTKKEPLKKYIPSAVFLQNKPTPEDDEQALVLSHLFHHAASDHLRVEKQTTILGTILMALGGAAAAAGAVKGSGGSIGAGVVLLLFGLLILVYGMFIHKPKELVGLSKVYSVSYIMPFSSAVVIDGSDIVPDQTLQYHEVPLDDICVECEKLPKPELTLENEERLVTTLSCMEEHLHKKQQRSLTTPAVLDGDPYQDAVVSALRYASEGWPSSGFLKLKLDYSTAVKYSQDLIDMSSLDRSVRMIKGLRGDIDSRSQVFCENLTGCIASVDTYFGRVTRMLQGHFFSSLNIIADPQSDIQYGYGIAKAEFHIAVGQFQQSPDRAVPLDPVQLVIDNLDEEIKDRIVSIRSNSDQNVRQREQSRDQMKNQTVENYRMQIRQQTSEAERLGNEINMLKMAMADLDRQEEEYSKQARMYAAYQQTSAANSAIGMAQNCRMQYNQKVYEINSKEQQVRSCMMNVKSLESERDGRVKMILSEATNDIAEIRTKMRSEITSARRHIDPIVEERNRMLSIMRYSLDESMETEHTSHKEPFTGRLKAINDIKARLHKDLKDRAAERSGILEHIDKITIEMDVPQPIKVAIPFWIAAFSAKGQVEHLVLPPRAVSKPTVISRWGMGPVLASMDKAFEATGQYLAKDRFYEEAQRQSSYPSKLSPGLRVAIEGLCQQGYFSEAVCKRMKKAYGLEGGA